jgi:hypothetical protein
MTKYLEKFEKYYKSPEEEINSVCEIAGKTENTEKNIKIRRQILEIEELTQQLRWHIYEALKIYEEYPEIKKYDSDFENSAEHRLFSYMPTSSKLLLRPYIVQAEKVDYKDLTENRRGKLVAGWILSMFIDNIITRTISILDRIANTIAIISDTNFNNGKVYFRSGKLATIQNNLPDLSIQSLIEISKNDLFDLLLKIRDESAHVKKVYSVFSDTFNSDTFETESAEKVTISDYPWKSSELFGLTNFAFSIVCSSIKTLNEVLKIKIGG